MRPAVRTKPTANSAVSAVPGLAGPATNDTAAMIAIQRVIMLGATNIRPISSKHHPAIEPYIGQGCAG